MLDLRHISKRLGDFTLEGLDLRVEPGAYFVLLGPSGVGKTVLLETIAGLIRPDAGQVLWRGRDVTHDPPEQRPFGIVYQDYALFPHMTVSANIAYGLRARGVSTASAKRAAEDMARRLDIAELLPRWPRTLSGGEAQRVALARALATEPELLLLDEPLGAVDPAARLRLRKLLRRLHETTATTFVHVTHDLDEATFLADRVGVMLRGRLRQIGCPEELVRRPGDSEVAAFLGLQNVLEVVRIRDGVCRAGEVEIRVDAAPAETRHVWVRPEEIVLSRGRPDSPSANQYLATVVDWHHSKSLLAVRLDCVSAESAAAPDVEALRLTALIAYGSFDRLGIDGAAQLHAAFETSAIHCF